MVSHAPKIRISASSTHITLPSTPRPSPSPPHTHNTPPLRPITHHPLLNLTPPSHLNPRPPRKQRPPIPQKEQRGTHHPRDKPQQHIRKINPHRALHPRNPRISLRISPDIQLPENPKQCRPQHTTTPPPKSVLSAQSVSPQESTKKEGRTYKRTTSHPNAYQLFTFGKQ